MRFTVLGDLEVHGDDGPLTIAAPKQRLLLAVLLCRRGRTVSADALVELLWPDGPPASARKALTWHVMKTREVIGRDRITFGGNGYDLTATDAEIDAEQFRLLVNRAAAVADGDPETAERWLIEALALWRGEAFGELAEFEPMRQVGHELTQLRLRALESHGDIGLRLGRHDALVPELTVLVA